VYDPEARPLFLAPQVEEAEERWNAWDQDLSEIEHAARANPDVSLEEVLAIARDHCLRSWEDYRQYHDEESLLEAALGVDHPRTEDARDLMWLTARFHVVAELVWEEAIRAAIVAIRTGQPPGRAALLAVAEAHIEWQPIAALAEARVASSERARTRATVDLAARLLVKRPWGDTGIVLWPSQHGALWDDAIELGVPTARHALREQLPAAVLSAALEAEPDRDLRALRTDAMAIIAPSPRGRRGSLRAGLAAPGSANASMAPTRSWSPTKPVEELEAEALSVLDETAAFEEAVLDRLAAEELEAWTRAEAPTLPAGQRRVLDVLLKKVADHEEIPASEEIAAELGIAPPTVRVHAMLFRRALKQRRAGGA
jgi:hypothetical protein